MLEFDVGRVADDAVEAAVAEDIGKRGLPVEGVDALALVLVGLLEEGCMFLAVELGEVGSDQAVAAADVAVEGA